MKMIMHCGKGAPLAMWIKSPRWTWILLSEGQTLPYYTKGTSRTKMRPSHVKIIIFRPLIWAVDRFTEEEEDGQRKSWFGRFLYIPLAMVSSYFVSVSGRETLEEHSQLPIKANKCSVGAVASFSYVWRHRHVRVIPT